jgi:hypothetical protein
MTGANAIRHEAKLSSPVLIQQDGKTKAFSICELECPKSAIGIYAAPS